MSDKYILGANGEPVVCLDLIQWARWFENADTERHLGNDHVGEIHVSTVFLGLDHSWGFGRPMLWETMIFGGEHDQFQERYATRAEALEGHARALAMVRGTSPDVGRA